MLAGGLYYNRNFDYKPRLGRDVDHLPPSSAEVQKE
jgi:hypothetical protein